MTGLIALIAVISIGIIVALFVIEYVLGRKQKKTSIALVAPIIYVLFRAILVIMSTSEPYTIMRSIFWGLVTSGISLIVFFVTKNNRTRKNK